MNGTENDTTNATSDSFTENVTLVKFTHTSVAPAVHYRCDNYDLFMGFFVKVTIVLFGTIGNILTIFVLWGEKKKTGTAFLLVVLAFADTSVLIVWGWMDAMPALMTYWNILRDLNRIWGYFDAYVWALGSMTHLLSTWLVTMVTFLRYIAVCHPLKAGKWISVKMVQWATLICVVASVVFYLPRCFEYGVKYDATNDKYVREKRQWASGETYNLTYKVIIYYLFIYVIPLSLLIYCTCQLTKSLKGTKKKKEKMTANKQKSENKEKDMDFTKCLIIVVIIFIICQLLNPIRRFLYDFFLERYQTKCPYFYHYFFLLSGNVLMLNSAVNFLCYFLSARGFKRKLYVKCSSFRFWHRRVGPEVVELSQTP